MSGILFFDSRSYGDNRDNLADGFFVGWLGLVAATRLRTRGYQFYGSDYILRAVAGR